MKKIKKNRLAGQALIKALESACRNLYYISETDAPIEPFVTRAAKGKTLLEIAEHQFEIEKKQIEKNSVRDFFDKLTAERDWHSGRDRAKVKRFVKLRELLESNLTEMSLFRAGRVRIDILVLGFDVDGNVTGIRTKAVET